MLLARLGSPGALRNVEDAIRSRRTEEQAIAALAERLALVDTPAAVA